MVTMNDLKGNGAKFFGAGGSGPVSWNDLKDRPFYESVGQRVTLSNVENPNWSYNMATIGKGVKLVEGQTCYVSFGTGKVYEFVATRMDMGGIEGIVIGNPDPKAWDGDYSNEPEFPYNFPFSIVLSPENELVASKNSEIKKAFWPELEEWEEKGETLDVEADEIVVKTLDPKFLPFRKYTDEVLAETRADIVFENDETVGFVRFDTMLNVLRDGTYTVTWDGKTHECPAVFEPSGGGCVVLGNSAILSNDRPDTGEPFCVVIYADSVEVASFESGTHTISITGPVSAVMPDAEGETVTAEEFNTLLDMLRKMGILAAEGEA